MSKCPFWSTKKEKINCYNGCPMKGSIQGEDDDCPFKEVSDEPKVLYKDIENENFAYSQEKYGEYDFLKKISNY